MQLIDKYRLLFDAATTAEVKDLTIHEDSGVLTIKGIAANADIKNTLWNIYNQIDPNYFSSEVVMDVSVTPTLVGKKVRVLTDAPLLPIRKGPGVNQAIIGNAQAGEVINLLSRAHDQWWLVRTSEAVEGYCYTNYLEPCD
ncbi:SH3 domain-containing protein [Sphingobacterium sp. LRF_L2]|uniref:SH3 domain-containing protein n=1 Tax=Sphingobacterium sp. LRF_L2 TaxID=3369421 RepID=UPI003F60C605